MAYVDPWGGFNEAMTGLGQAAVTIHDKRRQAEIDKMAREDWEAKKAERENLLGYEADVRGLRDKMIPEESLPAYDQTAAQIATMPQSDPRVKAMQYTLGQRPPEQRPLTAPEFIRGAEEARMRRDPTGARKFPGVDMTNEFMQRAPLGIVAEMQKAEQSVTLALKGMRPDAVAAATGRPLKDVMDDLKGLRQVGPKMWMITDPESNMAMTLDYMGETPKTGFVKLPVEKPEKPLADKPLSMTVKDPTSPTGWSYPTEQGKLIKGAPDPYKGKERQGGEGGKKEGTLQGADLDRLEARYEPIKHLSTLGATFNKSFVPSVGNLTMSDTVGDMQNKILKATASNPEASAWWQNYFSWANAELAKTSGKAVTESELKRFLQANVTSASNPTVISNWLSSKQKFSQDSYDRYANAMGVKAPKAVGTYRAGEVRVDTPAPAAAPKVKAPAGYTYDSAKGYWVNPKAPKGQQAWRPE